MARPSAKQVLIDEIMERIAKDNAEDNSKLIEGEVLWHKLFVVDMARIEHQLEQIPFATLQDQVEAGSFAFCNN